MTYFYGMSYFVYTIGLPLMQEGEMYEFDGERTKIGSADQPFGRVYLTRPLSRYNPITMAKSGTCFQKLVVRQYDRFGNLLKKIDYNDVKVVKLEEGPNLVLEFTYKP